jgi:hypothetical protein
LTGSEGAYVNVIRAMLCFYAEVPEGIHPGKVTVRAATVTSEWHAGTVGWNTWTLPGGDYAPYIGTAVAQPGESTGLCIDVVPTLLGWYNEGVDNYGFLLMTGADWGGGEFGLASGPASYKEPILHVYYELEGE